MRPCLLILWLFVSSSCAQSPVVDFIEEVPDDADPELPEPEPTSDPEDEEPPVDDADDVQVQTDPLTEDAGSPPSDAGAPRDAASSTGVDAGRDAGASRPSLIPGLPALPDLIGTLSPPRTRACMRSADCTVSCFPLGAVACCRNDKTCGCSWAPGAYCL